MLLDMPALARRLAQGDLIAMLDVFDREPLETDSPLRSLPNTYLTPHRAGGLVESIERAFSMLIGDLEAHLSGAPRRYELTPQAMASLAE
jgi:phosphoglycerate dehydrogenase-like enzyme